MLCENCKKNQGIIKVTQVRNNKEKDFYLCQQCVNNYQQYINNYIGIASDKDLEFIFNIFSEFNNNSFNNTKEKIIDEKICDKCGMSFRKISKEGKVGCDNCYNIFNDELKVIIKKNQVNLKHIGKYPSENSLQVTKIREVEKLRKELEEKIILEEYEEAAKLRDEIIQLERGKLNE